MLPKLSPHIGNDNKVTTWKVISPQTTAKFWPHSDGVKGDYVWEASVESKRSLKCKWKGERERVSAFSSTSLASLFANRLPTPATVDVDAVDDTWTVPFDSTTGALKAKAA